MKHYTTRWIVLFLVLITSAVFFQVKNHDFINYDDNIFVTENPQVRAGLTVGGVIWALTTKDVDYWRPLSMISHMVDVQLFGLNPAGHHMTNLLLHLLATVLLFAALQRMTAAPWRSGFVAALFAIHPLHVESVAWIAERKDVMSGFFWMLTLWLYARYAENSGKQRYWAVMLAVAGALMSKPMAVTLPAVLLLMDYWPLNRLSFTRESFKTRIMEKMPLFALALVLSVITFVVVHEGGSVASLGYISFGSRLANAIISYGQYIAKMFWPSNLSVFYPYPETISPASVIVASLSLLLVTSAVLRASFRSQKSSALLTGWFWFLGTLLPVIGIIQAGNQAMADRYTYIPLVGLFIMVTWGVADWVKNQRVLGIAGSVVLLALGTVAYTEVHYWKDSRSLFAHALASTSRNYVAHNNLGVALASEGNTTAAIEHYREAVKIRPVYYEAYSNQGIALAQEGRIDEAIVSYRAALELKPDFPETLSNLGVALAAKGLVDEAITNHQKAMRLNAEYAPAYNNLGHVLMSQNKHEQAKEYLQKALQLDPYYPEAHNNLGIVLAAMQQPREAQGHYEEALRLKPKWAEAYVNLGIALAMQKELNKAISHFQRAIEISPELAKARANFGIALFSAGRFEESIEQFTEALRLNPEDSRSRANLEVVRMAQKKAQPDSR
ncbi:MAG: hypothetical protein A2070_15175 [Bdellovibrionales bacterium GWC1_52_8]|nr:MAG: hypothetical protein A2Z97_05575 [Bdellovibrionales bacterium GWB1_52_6]OFZ04346.1 MAG: hypothetical protein A2X97_06790 [Bdellovibrionales bacterium GWA1_52_35]OFZ40362.1 MAG: hypothetical protein A2070_15175 [Bdellovibrionales bacterium GWC1_52_8]HCM40801.1 hypothetical protein [Bdellovibrionales bacterium]